MNYGFVGIKWAREGLICRYRCKICGVLIILQHLIERAGGRVLVEDAENGRDRVEESVAGEEVKECE